LLYTLANTGYRLLVLALSATDRAFLGQVRALTLAYAQLGD
jgi:hypothetical protein